MDLKELYDKLIAEGCNQFYIEGIGGPQDDDVERLGMYDGEWQVRYFERGSRARYSSQRRISRKPLGIITIML